MENGAVSEAGLKYTVFFKKKGKLHINKHYKFHRIRLPIKMYMYR